MSTEKEIVDTALANQVARNGDLAQAAAVALRSVLPYAREEVMSIHDVALKDGSDEAVAAATTGENAILRAENVLEAFEKSHLPIAALKDDHFDDSIDTFLDEQAGEE